MVATASEIIGKLMDELRTVAKTETILGNEIKVGDFTLIPVSKISLGFGAGGGKGTDPKREGEGGGGGGGVCVTPVAFVVIKGGEISFHGIKRGGTLSTLFEQLPELAEKFWRKEPEAETSPEEPEAG
ncbi:MAG: sporulation protein [Deltaproteobacteria bacterium]|nr:sporulation protein [Deltaproteobacteria bacterium]